MKYVLFIAGAMLCTLACQNPQTPHLPILGEKKQGKNVADTIYHTIPPFKFLSQDSVWVTEQTVSGKIYVADFFFTSCQSICPIMARNMLKVYTQYHTQPDFLILSHSIDPETDTVPELKKYAKKLKVLDKKWLFLYGSEDSIYDIAENAYMAVIKKPSNPDEELAHSGYFLLIDKKRRVRGIYDGTNDKATAKLIKDIAILSQEE